MRELNGQEISSIHGGKKLFSKVIDIFEGALLTGIVEGLAGFMAAGPAGFMIGFEHGAYEGAIGVIIYQRAKEND